MINPWIEIISNWFSNRAVDREVPVDIDQMRKWISNRQSREKMQMHRQSRETLHYSLMVKVKEKEKQRVIDALKSLEFLKMDQEIVHGKILVELDEVIKTIKDMAERLKIIVP